jgi:endo-alpha-1,4-polygalactosaminidase (GH114 family)
MARSFKKKLSCVIVMLMLLTLIPATAFAGVEQTTVENAATDTLKAEIKALYASEPGALGRLHKMQAFIMEIALHAKTLNPDFKIIPQDGINLAFKDGDSNKGFQESLISLVDGWGIEGMVGTSNDTNLNQTQEKYKKLVDDAGIMVTDTTSCTTQDQLNNYYTRANTWGFIPYPRIGGALAQTLFPGWRWGTNGDYFWVEDPEDIGISDRIDGARDVVNLTDAKNYLYNINGRPYDAWDTWDAEEAEYDDGDGDRTRIADSYACGLLVPSEGGQYKPVGSSRQQATIDAAISEYGDEWDWWWRVEGLDEKAGRETWLNALRSSNYDIIYIDSFYNHRAAPENQTPLTKSEVDSLKYKPDGGRRQVIAYLSIGSAEQNRWYCQDDWVFLDPDNPNTYRSMKAGLISDGAYVPNDEGAPSWLAFTYGGGYDEEAIVQWWHPEWRDIIINGGSEYKNIATGDYNAPRCQDTN